jgi:endonuclease/exonuclease/phosphatase family metal-dependent hydrolase
MRLATFNVENMFQRPKAMNLDTWADGKKVLEDFAELNRLIQEAVYSDEIKARLLEIAGAYKGLATTGESRFILLREIRGGLFKKPKNKPVEVAVDGRADWIGWFELVKVPVKETATENTARIIDIVHADVQCVIEAEDRTLLQRFNHEVIKAIGGDPFAHVMLVDGNDARGIDVGFLSRDGYPIVRMLSHVDDTDEKGLIFSRDCAEYEIETPSGSRLLLLVNHFKSKGYGSASASAAKRLRQATRARAIYDRRMQEGYKYVAVLGDLNEVPDAAPMAPLSGQGSTLTDVMVHPLFQGDSHPGTWGSGAKSGKFDYILMSPALCQSVTAAGIERRGVWGKFPHLPEIKTKLDAASDHAALWVDANI